MRFIFVRHGEPDYARDCLTETGKRQAAAAAVRLEGESISEIWSSPMGRARETAEAASARLGLPVRILPWMHEITWGGEGIPENGHPWTLGEWLIDRENFDFARRDWREHPWFEGNAALSEFRRIAGQIDGFLAEHGYRHEGVRFRCETGEERTIALFSHGGSGACALSHILALPFPYVCTVLPYEFTSVIVLNFPVREGEWVHPRIELFNDAAHIRPAADGPVIQQRPD